MPMTNEQAYKILTEHTRQYVGLYDLEALEVAIKVLAREREIVRCEECRHGKRISLGPQRGLYECRLSKGYLWSKNDFCSYGERKEVECDGEVRT